jgi:hypothetical protein
MPNRKTIFVCSIIAFFGFVVPVKSAAQQEESTDQTGVTTSGLRGINRVGVPTSTAPSLMIAGSAGYGFTESIGAIEGSHHRLHGILSGGFSLFPWLAFGLSFDGRYDIHPEDDDGSDSSIVGDPRLLARGGYRINELFQIGGEIGLLLPGSDAPSIEFEATTLDTKILFAYTPEEIPLTIAALTGFRFDNSGESAPQIERVRTGDRLSLGLSDFNAVLVGLGGSYRIWQTELIAEFTWDMLVGEGSPDLLTSPMRIAAGARQRVLPPLSIELLTETVLSKRPGASFDDVMIPIEPRFSVLAGLRFVLDFSEKKPIEEKPVGVAPKPIEGKPKTASVIGTLVDETGNPVISAHVAMKSGDRTVETDTDQQGAFRFDEVPLGEVSLRATADGFEDVEWTVRVIADMPAQQPHQMTKIAPETPETPGAQLRGLIRAFDGKPLSATITIAPLGKKLTTDANGQFEVDVPPGAYTVAIRSYGYQTQRRRVTVDANGVSIINADLRKKRNNKR